MVKKFATQGIRVFNAKSLILLARDLTRWPELTALIDARFVSLRQYCQKAGKRAPYRGKAAARGGPDPRFSDARGSLTPSKIVDSSF